MVMVIFACLLVVHVVVMVPIALITVIAVKVAMMDVVQLAKDVVVVDVVNLMKSIVFKEEYAQKFRKKNLKVAVPLPKSLVRVLKRLLY